MKNKLILIGVCASVWTVAVLAQTRTIPWNPSTNSAFQASNLTEVAHGASAPTWTSVVGNVHMMRASTTVPTAVSTNQPVAPFALTTGALGTFPNASAVPVGDTPCAVVTTASANPFNCKGSPGNIYDIYAGNATATVAYVRFFNQTSSPGSCSSSTNFVGPPMMIPANTSGAGVVRTFPVGRAFATGISGCVSGAADGTTNAPAGVNIDIGYQ